MAAYELEKMRNDEASFSKVQSSRYSPGTIDQLYLEMTQSDIAELMEIVSELHRISSIENNKISILSRRLEKMLGVGGSVLGIYFPANREHQVIFSSIRLEFTPSFNTYPCPLNGVLSYNCEHGDYSLFFDGQGENFYTYLCLSVNVNSLLERQKQIIKSIIPYLFSCMKKNHLISCRLTELGLTTREQEVVKWMIEGKDNWSISRILNVSERTVKFHNCNIYKKLGVSAKAEVICEYYKLMTSIGTGASSTYKVGAS